MSQFPNYNQPGTPPNPFAAGPAAYQPPKSSNAWLWTSAQRRMGAP